MSNFGNVFAPAGLEDGDSIVNKLAAEYELIEPHEIIADALTRPLFSVPAVVSSFGAESVVLLHLVAQVKPDIPILLVDTGKLFGETLRYRDRLQHLLGLEDVRTIAPRKKDVDDADPMGALNRTDPDACCDVRKTQPLNRLLSPFNSWISGRKRHQSSLRARMPIVEIVGRKAKLNPLANWSREKLNEHIVKHRLPEHPLMKDGYLSIGCISCSERVQPGEDPRAGRWANFEKTECGIHLPASNYEKKPRE